jgi:hypothetical protein
MFGLTDAPPIGALAKHVPRGLGSSSDMIAGIGSPPLALLPLYTSRGAVGSVTQSLPVEPTWQKNQARIAPSPILTRRAGYIRPCGHPLISLP